MLNSEQFFRKIKNTTQAVIIDVRSPGELKSGKIEGARNINLYDFNFEQKIKTIDKYQTVLVYCSSGSRSKEATEIFMRNGFGEVYELKGGLRDWKQEGFPIVEIQK